MIVEERNIDSKTVSFLSIDQYNGNLAWKAPSFGDPWWVGIEAVHEEALFLHGFATPDLPEHKGVIAVDLKTGARLWEESNAKFIIAHGDAVLVLAPTSTGTEVHELDYRTGGLRRNLGNEPGAVRSVRQLAGSDLRDEMELPVPLNNVVDAGSAMEKTVLGVFGNDLNGPVEVIDRPPCLVAFGHLRQKGTSSGFSRESSVLQVLDKSSKQILYTETGIDSFFVYREMLFYVKEQKHLIAVRLSLPLNS